MDEDDKHCDFEGMDDVLQKWDKRQKKVAYELDLKPEHRTDKFKQKSDNTELKHQNSDSSPGSDLLKMNITAKTEINQDINTSKVIPEQYVIKTPFHTSSLFVTEQSSSKLNMSASDNSLTREEVDDNKNHQHIVTVPQQMKTIPRNYQLNEHAAERCDERRCTHEFSQAKLLSSKQNNCLMSPKRDISLSSFQRVPVKRGRPTKEMTLKRKQMLKRKNKKMIKKACEQSLTFLTSSLPTEMPRKAGRPRGSRDTKPRQPKRLDLDSSILKKKVDRHNAMLSLPSLLFPSSMTSHTSLLPTRDHSIMENGFTTNSSQPGCKLVIGRCAKFRPELEDPWIVPEEKREIFGFVLADINQRIALQHTQFS